ncbi:MAG: hypothetical protein AB202_02715 [Parcubacteria bacterium C7867-007]|nr:MAG: hypothetical protein AB202_02715 [Parcubacteria bacterium C7867-007]
MKKSDASKAALLEQLRKTPILQVGCEKVGISRVTLYRWRAENADFAKSVDDALLEGRLMVNDLAEGQLIGAIKDRNMTAVMGWLKHNHPSYRTKVQIEGTVNTIQELSDEQKELVHKALSLANLTLKPHEPEQPS